MWLVTFCSYNKVDSQINMDPHFPCITFLIIIINLNQRHRILRTVVNKYLPVEDICVGDSKKGS